MSKLFILLLLLFCTASLAEPLEPGLRDLMHSRNYAMGGAYRAHGLGAETASGNPAAITLHRRYQVELSGAWDVTTKYAFGSVGVVDSSTSEMAAGLSYHLVTLGRGEQRRVAHLNTVALALPLSESIHLGVSGRHVLMSGAREANAITTDAGLLIRPIQVLAISFSGHNLIDTNNPELTRYYALAFAFFAGPLTAALDVRADFGFAEVPVQLAYSGGVEYLLGGALPLRAGYSLDTIAGTQHLSAGVGYMADGSGFDLGYRQELGGNLGRLISLTFKMQMR